MNEFNETKLDDNESCTFEGSEYSHGSEICSGGKMLRCHDGEWEDIGEECDMEEIQTFFNNSRTAFYKDNGEAKEDDMIAATCVKYEFNPRDDLRTVYLVNGCNKCMKVRIHWWAGNKEAWTVHSVKADTIILIRKVYYNSRIVSEVKCKD